MVVLLLQWGVGLVKPWKRADPWAEFFKQLMLHLLMWNLETVLCCRGGRRELSGCGSAVAVTAQVKGFRLVENLNLAARVGGSYSDGLSALC